MDEPLTSEEMRLWHAWKTMRDTVWNRIARDITGATGLSDQDYAVLSRLEESGQGKLGQQQLADMLGWSKSRLSHHLTRMQERHLIERQPHNAGVVVKMTSLGQEIITRARPVHARAVRQHLLDRLTVEEKQFLAKIMTRLESE